MPTGVYVRTEKIRRNIGKAMRGKKNALGYRHTEEAKRKISENHIGMLGKHHTKETKDKIGNGNRGKIVSEETKLKMRGNKNGLGYKHTKEAKEKIRLTHEGIKFSERRKRAIGEKTKVWWAKFSLKERRKLLKKFQLAGTKAALQTNPSSIEKMIWKVLDKFNVKYKIQHRIGKWYVDIFIPNRKLIIECNGDYWHSLPNRIKRDKELQKYCNKNNYKLAWIWENEIRKNPKLVLKNGLKKVIC